jgi:hypothetical protein
MLTIRHEQMRVLQRSLFHRWLVSEMKSRHPKETHESRFREIDDFVEEAVSAGIRAGAESIDAIRKYLHLAFMLGPHFLETDTPNWVRAIWARHELATVFERLEEIERALALQLPDQSIGRASAAV